MSLALHIASVFGSTKAKRQLKKFESVHRLTLPTFNLATTSLRHLPKWFDHLKAINEGNTPHPAHGNYFSDPAAIGLVDHTVSPPTLTEAGKAFLNFKSMLYKKPSQAEYQLIKILYFNDYAHSERAKNFLMAKLEHMEFVLNKFVGSTNQELFIANPSLLVILELISTFDKAAERFVNLPVEVLTEIPALGENKFKSLCTGPQFSKGLNKLCNKIGNEYTRAEERRLHYIISMLLLNIAQDTPPKSSIKLNIPAPYSNLISSSILYRIHSLYTSDLNIWFDGVDFRVSSSLPVPKKATPKKMIKTAKVKAMTELPKGRKKVNAADKSRRRKKKIKPGKSRITVDPVIGERAEDYVESDLKLKYGSKLVRVGHRMGENFALPDELVPGADFYILDDNEKPIEFIEVKSITGNPPADITLSRAEYWRACDCADKSIPYRLILVDITKHRMHVVGDFASSVARLDLKKVVNFVIRIENQ